MGHSKRNSNRCPTHPGALLREDVIPATRRTNRRFEGLIIFSILQFTDDRLGGEAMANGIAAGGLLPRLSFRASALEGIATIGFELSK